MLIRQLLSEIPDNLSNPSKAVFDINIAMHDIETQASPGIFATLVGIHLDESNRTGRLVRAGAPGLVKINSNGRIEQINPEGYPLGIFPDSQVEEVEFPYCPGDRLVWVSDGLLGVRNAKGQSWGENGLNACIKNSSQLPARAIYERILASIGDFAASDMARDDWSLIVAGFDPEPDWQMKMPGGKRDELLQEALRWIRSLNRYGSPDLMATRTILGEAFTNAHEHGNNYNDDASIEVKLTCTPGHIHMKVRDEGGKLNERVTNPSIRPEKILEDKGRGFLLMRHQSDHLWVEEDRGELNAVRIVEDSL
jgi:anti-sigma regulatory factor (Ser/Thr protein kinase)